MRIDPFSQSNIIPNPDMPQQSIPEDSQIKRPFLLPIILILLLLFLVISIYLLGTKTTFFNFASGLPESNTQPVVATVMPSKTPDTSISTTSATTTDISTSSSTIAIPVKTFVPVPTSQSVALDNSYMFASPLSAATGNIEKIRITVFILDETGGGISGKSVSLSGVDNLAVSVIQATTDQTGKAVFDVAAGTSGSYEIGARVGESSINQKVTVTFN